MKLRSAAVLGTAPFHKGRSELFTFTLIPHISSHELYGYSKITYDPLFCAVSVDRWFSKCSFYQPTSNSAGNPNRKYSCLLSRLHPSLPRLSKNEEIGRIRNKYLSALGLVGKSKCIVFIHRVDHPEHFPSQEASELFSCGTFTEDWSSASR
jgi:hypothetical protein